MLALRDHMAEATHQDPYALRPENIAQPPSALSGVVRLIGPGLILASSIVGSGELIATTVLGAENGYILLWLIVLSCLVKTVVQNELGRYAIGTGRTTLEAFDDVPGPRFKVSWLVWMWCGMVSFTLFQVGAMLGGIAEILNRALPAVPITGFVWLLAALSVVLLIAGKYLLVERIAMALVVSFTALTVSCCFLLFKLPQYFDWGEVLTGLTFQPPEGGMGTAVAAFGITGVGATELVMYPYWCIEKGYAQFAGKRDDSSEWARRALGWIRVMGFDVLLSMVIYTFATIAFYFPRGRGSAGHGLGARRFRNGPRSLDNLHRDARRMVAWVVHGWCLRRAVFDCVRVNCRALQGLGRPCRDARFLRQVQLQTQAPRDPGVRRNPARSSVSLFHVGSRASANGQDRGHRASDHVARHRRLCALLAVQADATEHPPKALDHPDSLGLGTADGAHDGLLSA